MALSPKQLEANRRNALASTGPRTEAGKAASSQNALQHGLLSQQVLLQDEDAAELQTLSQELRASLAPVGALEALLADRIVATIWRLRRVGRVEAGILDWGVNAHLARRARLRPLENPKSARLSAAQKEEEHFRARQDAAACTLGLAFSQEVRPLSMLSRYEASLERTLHRALHELQRLQAARSGAFVPPPLALDLDVTSNHPLQLKDQR